MPASTDTDAQNRMRVVLNGSDLETTAATLGEFCVEAGYGEMRVACALNGEFVPASARAKTPIKAGDEIELVTPRQGG